MSDTTTVIGTPSAPEAPAIPDFLPSARAERPSGAVGYAKVVPEPEWVKLEAETGIRTEADYLEHQRENAEAKAQAELDAFVADWAKTPQNLAEYRFDYGGVEDVDAEGDAASRQWLKDAWFNAREGTALANDAIQFSTRWAELNSTQRAEVQERELMALEAAWKGDTDKNLDLARTLVRQLDKKHGGAISAWLEETGAGNSAAVIKRLADHARMLELHRKLRRRW